MIFLSKFLYNFGFAIFSLFYLPIFILKGKANKGASARFGNPPKDCLDKLAGHKVVWLHAVSVGEIGLAVRWAAQLKLRMPEAKILFTTTTVTGYEVASKIKSDDDALCYFPIDWSWAVAAFVKKISPSTVLLFETEIWPNLIDVLFAKRIPTFIVNGRISDRAFKKYLKAKFFLKHSLNRLSGIAVQDDTMKDRFVRLGADESRVQVTGNLKFEWSPNEWKISDKDRAQLPDEHGLFTWLCASTHPGEEEIVLDVYSRLRKQHDLRLVLAPRHVDRADDIEKTALNKSLGVRRYSKRFEASAENDREAAVFLIDKMGVLSDFYAASDAVFMGGSLVPIGGHNLVEPAYFGKPVLYGPYMQNFKSMVEEFENGKASVCVKDKEALEVKLVEWIGDARKRMDIGEAAKDLIGRHRGAAQKNLDYVLSVLEQSLGRRLLNV